MNLNMQLVESLRKQRAGFGRGWAKKKTELLLKISNLQLSQPRVLIAYHDVLLFMLTYPDNPQLCIMIQVELNRVANAAKNMMRNAAVSEALQNSGIANTISEVSFSVDLVRQLAQRYPTDIEINWDDDAADPSLDAFLSACISPVEQGGMQEMSISSRKWFELARGSDDSSALLWLIQRINEIQAPRSLFDFALDQVELPLRWHLHDVASRTQLRISDRPIFVQSQPLKRRLNVTRAIRNSIDPVRRLPTTQAQQLIKVAQATLAVRGRETDPVTHADSEDVSIARLYRGVDVALFSMRPDRRLPLESYVGYIAARNTVPVAYGGAWIFFDSAEVGINVFESFRGGENLHLLSQILRVYHHQYSVGRFFVDPYQFGADNEEGLRSGAFWFYYHAGFRPVDRTMRALAKDEFAAIKRNRTARTSLSVLRRLASGKLLLDLRLPSKQNSSAVASGGPDPVRLGLALTDYVGKKYGGDLNRAQTAAKRFAAKILNAPRRSKWPKNERQAFDHFSLLVSALPAIETWNIKDKRALLSVIRAKGSARELNYIRRLRKHHAFRSALLEFQQAFDASSSGDVAS